MENRIITHLGQKKIIKPDGSIPKHRPYFHRESLNILLKAVWQVPMEMEYKMCLTMRVWGVNPNIFNPLTHKEIAQFCEKHRDKTLFEYDVSDLHTFKVTEDDIKRIKIMEKLARARVQEYLKHVSNQEIIDRYNADFNKNQTNINRNLGKPLK